MSAAKSLFNNPLTKLGLVAGVAAGATVLVMLLYANISTRQQEARQTFFSVVELGEKTVDPAVWGKNFGSLGISVGEETTKVPDSGTGMDGNRRTGVVQFEPES